MLKNKFLIGTAVALLSLVGCDNRHHGHKKQVKVYHLHDGRYCYQDTDTMLWYWLLFSNNGGTHNYYTGTYSGSMRGVSWSTVDRVNPSLTQSKLEQPEEQELTELAIDSPESIMEETVVCDNMGSPMVDADGNLVDPESIAPDSPYDSPMDNSGPDTSPDNGGGDSGGGSDGGGDSGGGD